MSQDQLNNKWWFRLIKALYLIVFILFSVGVLWAVGYDNYPKEDPYSSTYQIKCNSGHYKGDINSGDLNIFKNEFNEPDHASMAKFACDNPKIGGETFTTAYQKFFHESSFEEWNKFLNKGPNYQIVIRNQAYTGSYPKLIGYELLAIIILILTFSLIRAIFYYIVANRKFWKTLFFKE